MINKKNKTTVSVFIFFFIIIANYLYSQAYDESWKLYDDSQVGRVDITIDSAKLAWMYRNVDSDSEHVASIRFKNKYIDEKIDSVGFRLRGNTSRDAKKKSFKISFNSFTKGGKFYNVEKLNLNGEHNDPSVIRSKLCFNHFKTIGLTASRACHTELYINGKYYGLYISVEHIDEEFIKKNYSDDEGNLWKCLYPADLRYLGDDQNIYKKLQDNGTPTYELSTNKEKGDFNPLVRLIKCINQTPDIYLSDSLESIFSVKDILKYFAVNILVGGWDEYWSLMNNYYLYYEPSKDIFHLIPYDYDNTFGIDWFNIDWAKVNPYNKSKVASGSRPLIEKILANPQYKNLYTHFIKFYSENVLALNMWEAELERLRQMITPYVISDPYYPLDYSFTAGDFFNSYSADGFLLKHVKYGIKQFVNVRNSSIQTQLGFVSAKPIVYMIDYLPKNPTPGDSIYVYVSAFSNYGIKDISIHYSENNSSEEKVFVMEYSPVANTKKVEESDRYTAVIPPLGAGKSGKFLVTISDAQSQSLTYPRKGAIAINASTLAAKSILINEFLADNKNSTPDPSGEHDDWVELYNPTDTAVRLTGKYMTDDPMQLKKWNINAGSLYLAPGKCMVIWCDEQQSEPGLHSNFKLSKSGEYIAIVDADGKTILDSITFGAQSTDISMGRYPDGGNEWKFMTPTPGAKNFATNVDNISVSPKEFGIIAFPNPFNPATVVQYQIPETSFVTLKLYDLLGREIESLVMEQKPAGKYRVEINGKSLSSGVYLCYLKAGMFKRTIKLQLLK